MIDRKDMIARGRKDSLRSAGVVGLVTGAISTSMAFASGNGAMVLGVNFLVSYVCGFCICALILLLEREAFRGAAFRSLPFYPAFALRIGAYLAVGSAVYLGLGALVNPGNFLEPGNLLVALGILALVSTLGNAIAFFQSFLGRSFWKHYLSSGFQRGEEVEAVFCFVDLVGSTSLAERVSPGAFFKVLNQFIFLVEEVCGYRGGEIYKYVGDCVVVVWRADPAGLAGAFTALGDLGDELDAASERFAALGARDIGFTAGAHIGRAVAGVIGDDRREIGYLGDAVNTAQRIQSACKRVGLRALVSSELRDRINASCPELGEKIAALRRFEGVSLPGKSGAMLLYGLPDK